ncbi:hypothetical protein [Sulfurimonas sp. HSL-1716]|uniref:hypothetical protein n=1 Tax=Hydrocurvibacter sulfurireducens TaxID=3131937 RepID=UPI0031F791D1
MLNVPELEKKWIKYKLKAFLPYILLFAFVIVSVPLVIIFYPAKKPIEKVAEPKKLAAAAKEDNKTRTDVNISVPPVVQAVKKDLNTSADIKEEDKLVLKPSLNFVNKMEDSMVTYYDDKSNNKKSVKKRAPQKTAAKVKSSVHPKPKVVKKKPDPVKEEKKSEITIKMHSVDKNLQDVIQRFKKTNNPVLSLFLAKKYYAMKKYDLSYNYALVTNQIDNKIDMSWIIFAKSLVKLGQKDMAVNTLKSYIKNSNSQTAITLLDEIQTGRFQ